MTETITIPRTSKRVREEEEQKHKRHPPERAFLMAKEVDTSGRVVVDTTTKERAELKRDQIHAFGPDSLLPRCKGSMSAVIEAAE